MTSDVNITEIAPGTWKISSRGRWWTIGRLASRSMTGWLIQNEGGQNIHPESQLGKKLIVMVKREEQARG